MTVADYFAGEHAHGEDDRDELLCTAPDELPSSPASCLSAALVDIARTAATASRTQFMRQPAYELQESTDLPPAEPPTV